MDAVESLITDFLERCKKSGGKPLVVVLGPTASGKTALSIQLAKKFNGEIISADSRQVYRGMDIGTDKIPVEAQGGVPHHLLDVVSPAERFTVADFKRLAEAAIDEILARGKLPIMAGGTGLYIRAVTENFALPECNDLALRKKIEEEVAGGAKNADEARKLLHQKLAAVDPESAKKIHPNNVRYVLRALEIFYRTGEAKKDDRGKKRFHVLKIGLNPGKEILDERIFRRVDEQFKRGLEREVRGLLAQGFDEKMPALHTLGYQEIIAAVRDEENLDAAKILIQLHTRQFARRQMTWFKKEKDVVWVGP